MRLKKKKSKKILIISAVIVLLLGTGTAAYFVLTKNSKDETSQSSEEAPEEGNSTADIETDTDDINKNISQEENNSAEEAPVPHEKEKEISQPYEGKDINSTGTLSGAITHISVADGTVIVRTNIDQSLSSGTCSLTLKNGSKSVTKSAPIAQNPSSSTCQGFNIPVSELSNGKWSIAITVTDSQNNNVTLTGEVSV